MMLRFTINEYFDIRKTIKVFEHVCEFQSKLPFRSTRVNLLFTVSVFEDIMKPLDRQLSIRLPDAAFVVTYLLNPLMDTAFQNCSLVLDRIQSAV